MSETVRPQRLVDEHGHDVIPFSDIMHYRMTDVMRDILKHMPVQGSPILPAVYLDIRKSYPGLVIPEDVRRLGSNVILELAEDYDALDVRENDVSVRLNFGRMGAEQGDVVILPYGAISAVSCPAYEFRIEVPLRDDHSAPESSDA